MDKKLSLGRNFKIGTFHIGSTMADVLGSGVWNRVMIQDLGYAATPVGLLLALRYFLAPLATWAGQRSDYTHVQGYRRLPWIVAGRAIMIFGYLLVAFSTVELTRHGSEWWSGIVIGFIVASVGYSISGSTFLALVYDLAGEQQRGRAVGVVWTFLLAGYAISGILFARLLPEYSETEFVAFFVMISCIMGGLWTFALWGEEKPTRSVEIRQSERPPILQEARGLMGQPSARRLALFMGLSFVGAFMQDALLEPFGGNVFGLTVGDTTRFQAYWGTMAIVLSGVTLWAHRKFPQIGYRRFTQWGILLLVATFLMLNLTALGKVRAMLYPSLILLGTGYGLWNIGTLGLMVEHTRPEKAGLDLGIWTLFVTVFRGGGLILGTILFDVFNYFTASATAYALIFGVEAVLLMASLVVLGQIAPTVPVLEKSRNDLILRASTD